MTSPPSLPTAAGRNTVVVHLKNMFFLLPATPQAYGITPETISGSFEIFDFGDLGALFVSLFLCDYYRVPYILYNLLTSPPALPTAAGRNTIVLHLKNMFFLLPATPEAYGITPGTISEKIEIFDF